jgi:nucleoside-diphosphate-sugar epimerase
VKVFVTGATGFVGSHLTEALVARGDTVLALARRPDTHDALTAAGATPVPGSLENERALLAALDGVEIVYHVAGLTSARTEAEFFAVNEAGTRRLLDAVRRAAPDLRRIVHVSSQTALGPSPRGTALAEEAECHPVTPYGRSKLAGELAVRGAGLPWVVVRPPGVYGPRDREFLRLFRLVRRGIAPVFGSGAQTLSLLYVEDLVRAIVLAGTHPAAQGQVFHIAHPEVVTAREVAKTAGAVLGRNPMVLPVPPFAAWPIVWAIGRAARAAGRPTVVDTDKLAEFLAPSWVMSVEKARRILGFAAEVPLAEGFARTAAWYRRDGWLAA